MRLIALLPALWLGCAAPRPAIEFRGTRRCHELQFRVAADGAALHELVVAVNGEVCHREGVPGSARVHGELAALCPRALLDEEAANLVEVLIVPPGCGPPLARRVVLCAGPEPD